MEPHVKQVIDLWKASSNTAQVSPYKMSQQLRNMAALFSAGPFYYYILDFPNLKFEYVHEGTKNILGIDPEDLTIEKLIEVLAPDERSSMAKKESIVVDFFMNHVSPEDAPLYKFIYFARIKNTEGRIKDILHQATILTITEDNKPEHVIVVHTDVSHLKFAKKDTMSIISLNGKTSYYDINIESGRFDPKNANSSGFLLKDALTKREIEIIKLISTGYNAVKISEELNISIHTLRTHRKNILKKSSCNSTAQLVAQSLMEGII